MKTLFFFVIVSFVVVFGFGYDEDDAFVKRRDPGWHFRAGKRRVVLEASAGDGDSNDEDIIEAASGRKWRRARNPDWRFRAGKKRGAPGWQFRAGKRASSFPFDDQAYDFDKGRSQPRFIF